MYQHNKMKEPTMVTKLYQAQHDHDHHHPIIQDLKVTVQHSTIVLPFQETQRKSIFLSNIDQVLNFHVQTVHFFPPNPHFPPQLVVEKLKSALAKVLVPYDFLAGRLKSNPDQSARLEFDCNAAGIGFVVASSDFLLSEIGDLVYPNPGFRQLVTDNIDKFESEDQPLAVFQVTSFKCGGFAIGVSTNHATFDGLSFKLFLQNLASQAAYDHPHLAVAPCNDRRLLAARSPPQVTFPHPELLKLNHLPTAHESNNPSTTNVFDCPLEDLDFQIFRLSSDDVTRLKEKAKAGLIVNGGAKVTGFNVVTAHVWRCKALSNNESEKNPDLDSTVLYAVDIRRRLNPPLPASYTGNAVLSAYATAACKELEEGPFSRLVEMVTEGSARMTDEYARSAIDWGEVYKGLPHGEFLISSWWRLGFADVEYPWGKPIYSCPVVYHRKDIILLFPNMDEANNSGVNVLVALPAKEMKKFEALFYKFLA